MPNASEDLYFNLGLIFLLILINGIFSLSEMSVVSSTRARLQKLIEEKRAGARTALSLHQEPTRFLSTVQVGITAVGILSGAFGEDALRDPLYREIVEIPLLAPYANNLALVATVAFITYFSVVIGEIIPKRLALLAPESVATRIAKPMQWLAALVSPLVWVLTASSHCIFRLLGLHRIKKTSITDEEIRILMEMGTESGVFHAAETRLVDNVMKLDELRVGAIMVPRQNIHAIDILEPAEQQRRKIADSPYTQLVVCRNGFENVLGVLHCGDLFKKTLIRDGFDIEQGLRPPLYVQDTMLLSQLLDQYRQAGSELALIVNEYGDIEGLVTLMDVLTAIVGEFPGLFSKTTFEIVQRADGSWLADGGLPVSQLKSFVGIGETLPGESEQAYNTLAGMVLFNLERLPGVGERVEIGVWTFEIVDIDGSRIDKILVSKTAGSLT